MKLKTKITTIGMSKGVIVPANLVYSDGEEILKGDIVIVTVEKVKALEEHLRGLNAECEKECE